MLALSACIFLSNAAHAWIKGYVAYGAAFCTLAVTSVLYHTSDYLDKGLYWIDQLALYNVFLIGLLYCARIPMIALAFAVLSISIVLLLFWGGYWLDMFCFHLDPETATLCHGIMHFVGAAGHHCILLGL